MVTYHYGDLLKSECDIIAHQVNLDGIMGGGLALQIADKYPNCEVEYKKMVENNISLGDIFYSKERDCIIANCFTQDKYYNTNYSALKKAFAQLRFDAERLGNLTVGIPHGYGCGIANGEWGIVEEIILTVFGNSCVDFQIWKL